MSPRGLAVAFEVGRQQDQLRAKLQRARRGHRRMHAEGARLVVAGGDHAARLGAPAHRERPSAQARVVARLDCGIEAVAIAVDDFSGDGHYIAIGAG